VGFAVPIFRPLRVLRLLYVVAGAGTAYRTVNRLLDRKGLQWFLVLAVSVIGLGAVLVMFAERNSTESQIAHIGDALWWSIVTSTTVGYGDIAPVTPAGRVVAVLLMLLGISTVSVVTANIAAVLVDEETESDLAKLEAKIDRLTAALASATAVDLRDASSASESV